MPILVERSLIKLGSCLAVTLPASWIRYYGLKAGDRVEIVGNGDLVIRLKREKKKEKV